MADDTSTPHFFLPLIPGFLTNFCIPKAFLKQLSLAESSNGNEFVAVLKDRNSDADNKAWPVKVDSNGRRFMDGWKEFAQDHSLRVGDFLIFRYRSGFVFDVLVLDPVTACERSFSVDPLIQSKSDRSEINEQTTESESAEGNALVFNHVSVDPLMQSESVQPETNEQHMTESEQVPSPSKGDALVFDLVSAVPLIQSESVQSEINEQHMTESEQVPSPSKGDALVFDLVSAVPLIQSESVQSETNEQHMTESEQVPSPSKGDALVFDLVSAVPLIQSESVQSETNEQHMTESEQVPSPSKGDAVSAADPLIQSESVHSETNEHNAEERVEFKPSGRPYICIPVKQYSLTWHAILIPTDFARKHNLAKRWCEMIIIDQKDRSWPVNLRYRKTGKDQVYLASGWDQVRDANGLKLGDSVVFEVIHSGCQPVMKLYKLS